MGLAMATHFVIGENAMDAILIQGWSTILTLLVFTDIKRPWRVASMTIEQFFAILKALFRGNHREISVLDAVIGASKWTYLAESKSLFGWDLVSLKGQSGHHGQDIEDGEELVELGSAKEI